MSIAEIVISIVLIAIIVHLFAFTRFINRKLEKIQKVAEIERL